MHLPLKMFAMHRLFPHPSQLRSQETLSRMRILMTERELCLQRMDHNRAHSLVVSLMQELEKKLDHRWRRKSALGQYAFSSRERLACSTWHRFSHSALPFSGRAQSGALGT
jgi:hypothetical protein